MCVRGEGSRCCPRRQLSTNPNKGSVAVDSSVLATFPKFHNFQKEKQSGLNLGIPSPTMETKFWTPIAPRPEENRC